MTETTTKCDHCGKSLVADAVRPKYRLRVDSVYVHPTGPGCSSACPAPPIPRTLDLCGMECLAGYLNAAAAKKAGEA